MLQALNGTVFVLAYFGSTACAVNDLNSGVIMSTDISKVSTCE